MEIRIDWERAEVVLDNLMHAYRAKVYPYKKMKLPQDEGNLPATMPRKGREHALFLWSVCYYMRLTESTGAVRSMAKLFTKAPGFFAPETFSDALNEHGDLLTNLRANGLGFQSAQIAPGWEFNSLKLERFWGGDPRTLYDGATSYKMLCGRIMNRGRKADNPNGFFGFQEKMVSMLTYFYVDAGIIEPIEHPVPVDFHVMRILITNQVVTTDDTSIPLSSLRVAHAGREISLWYTQKRGVDPLELCNALWHLSRSACDSQLGNRSTEGPYRGRGTVVTPVPIEWDEARERRFRETCGRCPINKTCAYNVPVAPYSRIGKLMIRGERPKPPQLALF